MQILFVYNCAHFNGNSSSYGKLDKIINGIVKIVNPCHLNLSGFPPDMEPEIHLFCPGNIPW